MEAASAASALPVVNTSMKCSALPAPPEAITGIDTAPAMEAVSSQSKPCLVPSQSIEVRSISPAPRDSASRAHSRSFMPAGLRPPFTQISAMLPILFCSSFASVASFAVKCFAVVRRASIATITACDPKREAISPIRPGEAMAAELMDTLSAPASKMPAASASVLMPPPTVNGMNNRLAARRTVPIKVPRPSAVAVMSSMTISSAPAVACRWASSAGSPASRSCANWTPLTTRPASTSSQAIIRLVRVSEVAEVFKNRQPCVPGFFRMKLCSKNIVPLDRRREVAAVTGAGHRAFDDIGAIAVRVVDKRAVGDAAQQARRGGDFDAVPAHVRRLDPRGEPRAPAPEQSRARRFRRLGAAFEKPLHADANTQKGNALGDGVEYRLAHLEIERRAAIEMSDAGNDDLPGGGNRLRFGGDFGLGAEMRQGFCHRAYISRPIIDNGDHSRPLVLGSTFLRRPSRSEEH